MLDEIEQKTIPKDFALLREEIRREILICDDALAKIADSRQQ
jgi:hypothetical protein